MNALRQQSVEVSVLEQVHIENFISEHLDFFLLQIGQLSIDVDHVLILYSFSNHLPFLFELEALVVVLDSPLRFIGCSFCGIRFGVS